MPSEDLRVVERPDAKYALALLEQSQPGDPDFDKLADGFIWLALEEGWFPLAISRELDRFGFEYRPLSQAEIDLRVLPVDCIAPHVF